jgi:hypothetical protein
VTLCVPRKSSGKTSNGAEIWRSGFLKPLQLALTPDEPAQERHRVGPDGADNHQKFDDIQSALGAFVFGN